MEPLAERTRDGARAGGFFRAVAVDYDGTLAEADMPDPDALVALGALRQGGVKALLVTGRILAELRQVFPGVDEQFDLIVAENGAVVSHGGVDRPVVAPVTDKLATALTASGVSFQHGQVLLACKGADEAVVLAEVRRQGLECELLRNRGSLMVLPSGVSKGSGLFEGLGQMGISYHNTIAIGDAENDHSFLDQAEIGVAVANSLDSLKAHADVVLDQPDGRGVASFLRGPVVGGRQRVHPKRWQIELGSTADGTAVTVPASQINLLVTGSPRRGKSYVAGLIAERLIDLRYSVVVFDPEGEHTNLGALRGVLVVGGNSRLPTADELVQLVTHRFASLVIDLSGVTTSDRAEYLRFAPAAIEAQRARTGLPHWVIVDEAQEPLGHDGAAHAFLEPATSGYCLITHRPEDLCAEGLLGIDALIALPGGQSIEATVRLLAAAGSLPRAAALELVGQAGPGHAVLVERSRPGSGRVFAIAPRDTSHLRHWHKYSTGKLAWERRFYFRTDWDTATGRTAGSLEELERELVVCSEAAIVHHANHGDLSRWVAEVLGDPPLAARLADLEAALRAGTTTPAAGRQALTEAIRHRQQG